MDYGVIREKSSGRTKAIWIRNTTITDIYDGNGYPYSKAKWEVVYRGPEAGYKGPKPDDQLA